MSDTAIALPTKEVEQTNKQVMSLQTTANTLTLKTPADVERAGELLEAIKQAEKLITTRKEDITRPLMRGLASVRDLFKPLELTLDNAKKVTKAKMLAYDTLEQEKIAIEKARIEARVEKGTMREDTAVSKIASVGTGTKMKTRTLTKVRVTDETLLPREFLTPNMTAITEAILRQGQHVPGAEKYTEKVVAS